MYAFVVIKVSLRASNNNVEGQNTIQTLKNRDFLNDLLCSSAGSGESAESQCEETGHWSVVRLRCGQEGPGGPGPLSRSGDTNVYFVESSQADGSLLTVSSSSSFKAVAPWR